MARIGKKQRNSLLLKELNTICDEMRYAMQAADTKYVATRCMMTNHMYATLMDFYHWAEVWEKENG